MIQVGEGKLRRVERHNYRSSLSGISRDQASKWRLCCLPLTFSGCRSSIFLQTMSDYTALTRLQVAVRAVDRETFVAAAKARQQTLQGVLAETLSVIAADLRTPPRARNHLVGHLQPSSRTRTRR